MTASSPIRPLSDLLDGDDLATAVAQLPADDPGYDPARYGDVAYQHTAAVLRHRLNLRAAQIVAAGPCPECLHGQLPALLTQYQHPYGTTVSLHDHLLEQAVHAFDLVFPDPATSTSLGEQVDDLHQWAAAGCGNEGCAARTASTQTLADCTLILSSLAATAWRDRVTAANATTVEQVITFLLGAIGEDPDSCDPNVLDLVATHPLIDHAHAQVPSHLERSDWQPLARMHDSCDPTAVAAAAGLGPARTAVAVASVAVWLTSYRRRSWGL